MICAPLGGPSVVVRSLLGHHWAGASALFHSLPYIHELCGILLGTARAGAQYFGAEHHICQSKCSLIQSGPRGCPARLVT